MHCSLAKNSSIIGLSCEPRSSQWNQRSKRTSVLSATKYLRSANMMIAIANYHVQQHNFKINLSPSVSSCRRSLSTTRPTVSAPRLGEWGILEKIFKRPILCPLLFNLQILQKNKDFFGLLINVSGPISKLAFEYLYVDRSVSIFPMFCF